MNLRLLAVGLVLVGCGEDALPIGADIPSRDTGRADVTVARQDTAGDISRVDLPVTDTGRDAEADALEDPSMDVPSDVTQAGGVVLFEVRAPGVGELESGGITAGFDRMSPEPGTPPIAEIGSCAIRHTSEGGDFFEEGPSFDAGLIEVTVGGTAYTLEYVDDRYVSSILEDQNEVFAYGAAIAVSAAGGFEVDAFEVSLVAPGDPVITEPVWGAFSSHDRANALRVDWAGAAGTGTIVSIVPVQVFPDPGIADGNAITCTVEDTGTFTVPVEALAYLPEAEGLGGGSVALTVIRFVNETVVAGATEVTGNATASHTIVGAIE